MPSRDYDPSQDDGRPGPRWSGEPSRDAARRETERRNARGAAFDGPPADEDAPRGHGGTFTPAQGSRSASAFGSRRDLRASSPAGPGSSHGGSGGHTSGSQAYGQRPAQELARDAGAPEAWDDRDGPPPNQQHSERHGTSPHMDSARNHPSAERRNAWTDAPRARSRPLEAEDKRPTWQRGMNRDTHNNNSREDDTQFDADYRQWRDEQMRLLDRDYAQWRQERYRKFAEEFSQWRSQRLQSRPSANAARPASVEHPPPPLGEISPLGTPADGSFHAEERERPPEPERERSGGLLGSLLGGHGDRSKP